MHDWTAEEGELYSCTEWYLFRGGGVEGWGFFHLNKTLEINCCLRSGQCVRRSRSRSLSGAKRPQRETPQTDRSQETCKCVKAASFPAPHFTSATLQSGGWKSALTACKNPKVTPPCKAEANSTTLSPFHMWDNLNLSRCCVSCRYFQDV